MRYFPLEAFLFGAIMLGALSWTAEVDLFRLSVPSLYEHMMAYALISLTLIASKGLRSLSVFEIGLMILIATATEAIKIHVYFRHPKTSDFYADIMAFIGVAISFAAIAMITRLIWRVILSIAR